jgi:hypothetical protein
LPLALWQESVFRRRIPEGEVVEAILADRRAALLYYGLFSLDEETLTYFAGHPSIISAIYENSAAIFAAVAEGITVRGGRVVMPGGDVAAATWQGLVGARAESPTDFVPRLLERDEGRLAWMFDTVTHLDAAHQAFALGGYIEARETRDAYFKAVYSIFAGFQREIYRLSVYPFERAAVDPAYVLGVVAVTGDGHLAQPGETAVWRAVFGVTEVSAFDQVTAPWLLQQVLATRGRSRLDTVLFAQRVCASARAQGSSIETETLSAVLSAFADHDALMLSLEQLGFVDPADYARAVAAATGLTSGAALDASLRAAMFQGALALVLRMRDVQALDEAQARRLVRGLVALPVNRADGYGAAICDWIEEFLVPAIAHGRSVNSKDADDWLLDGVSGTFADRPTPVVEWEDHAYRVDIAAGERLRLGELMRRQAPGPLAMAFDLRRLASLAAAASNGGRALERSVAPHLVDLLSKTEVLHSAQIFGVAIPSHADATVNVATAVRDGRADDALRELRDALDLVMADSMAAWTYAVAFEDPEASVWLVDRPARQHDFAFQVPGRGPWRVPIDAAPVVRGSLLGIARVLSPLSLRRTTLDLPPGAPRLLRPDSDGLAEAVVAMNAFRLTDAGRDTVV